jgi:hypothetical protein
MVKNCFHNAYLLQGTAQRFALPALGRAAGRRPIGKILRCRKMLGIAPESPASGARFVGRFLLKKRLNFLRYFFEPFLL